MLFNSHEFLFGFLPLCAIGFFLLARASTELAILWLVASSALFYGWWSPRYLGLLAASIALNFLSGRTIASLSKGRAKVVLATAVAANLAVLVAFKYVAFFTHEMNRLGADLPEIHVLLPIGISFYTFTQIAYLVDAYRGLAREYNPLQYALFVSWFPHLISGPVLHHRQMMPQFSNAATFRPSARSISVGLTMFAFGLAKKVLLADQFALYATPVFDMAAQGRAVPLATAWAGTLAYSLQLYFDFSGYSDMAIGISGIFNVKLPLNFNSPYKAESIIDFWRRWHMTLSAFLREYLYFPLGGNRHGGLRRYVNLMITMVLGGLWHGAGWGFIFWGALHGGFLVTNHLWRGVVSRGRFGPAPKLACGGATFLAVVVAWVPFRAESFSSTVIMLKGMSGGYGLLGSSGELLQIASQASFEVLAWLVAGLAVVWCLPNTQQLLARCSPAWDQISWSGRQWPMRWSTGLLSGLLFFVCILMLRRSSEFLYFQF
jgi:D-alanyl-lipoteichoic acid acyltransferase DltB (MBOAT superfamily)